MQENGPQVTMGVDQGLLMQPQVRPSRELVAETRPFAVLRRNEVFKNLTPVSGGKLSLEEIYIRIRNEQILTANPQEGEQAEVIIAVTGRSGSAKGQFGMGMMDLVTTDRYLQREAKKRDLVVRPVTILFTQIAQAAKLPEVGIVPPEFEHGTFLPEHYRRISQMHWDLVNQPVSQFAAEPGKMVVVKIIETSAPAVYPVSRSIPVEVEGAADRSMSVFYNLALDHERPNVNLFALVRDYKVRDQAVSDRGGFDPSRADIHQFSQGHLRFVLTDVSGKSQDIAKLPQVVQRDVARLMIKCTAPPSAMARSDREFSELLDKLFIDYQIEELNDRAFYEDVRSFTGVSPSRFTVLNNEKISGRTSYNLDYLLRNSLIAKKYPNLLREIAPSLLQFVPTP